MANEVLEPAHIFQISKHKCGSLPQNLRAEWFNDVEPEEVGRRTPVLWKCKSGHLWIDTKEYRLKIKGADKCIMCQLAASRAP